MVKLGANDLCWCGSGTKYKKCHRETDKSKNGRGASDVGASANSEGAARGVLSRLFGELGEKKTKVIKPEHPVTKGQLSPMRPVPAGIPRPDYAQSGRPKTRKDVKLIKDADLIARMRKACAAARRVLEIVTAAVKPGITTDDLDAIAHEACIREGGYPSPLNYHGYPKSVCTSVNEVICHGIPDSSVLREGDIVNCDVTIYLDGVHGDCSETVFVGAVDEASKLLVERTYESLMAGISVVRPGARICDVGKAIAESIKPHGYGIVRAFVGHGIGEVFHMDPQVPHFYEPRNRFKIEAGMTFTIEPMINLGVPGHRMWSDGWTAVTQDLQRSAQFEHTLLVTPKGAEILTGPEGGPQPFIG